MNTKYFRLALQFRGTPYKCLVRVQNTDEPTLTQNAVTEIVSDAFHTTVPAAEISYDQKEITESDFTANSENLPIHKVTQFAGVLM